MPLSTATPLLSEPPRPPPYGLRLAPGGYLALSQRTREGALVLIASLKASGLSLGVISRALAAQGILARYARIPPHSW